LLNEVGKPVDWRWRANAGWRRAAYGAFVYLNYVDRYSNPFSTPVGDMSSWTTVDMTLRVDGAQLGTGSWLQGLTATLSVNNLLDKDPPSFSSSLYGLKYDATNASPMGRFISAQVVKRW